MIAQFRFLFLMMIFLLLGSPTYAAQYVFSSSPGIEVPDDAYDGTLGSMAVDSVDASIGIPPGTSVSDVSLDLSLTGHEWIGDLVLKLESPQGTVLTLMSRPGFDEPADDGTSCCGNSSDLDGTPISFSDSGTYDAEAMGSPTGQYVCTDDGWCDYFPNPGSGPGTAFSDFAGENPSGTWNLYVGDAAVADIGTLLSWTLTIDTFEMQCANDVDNDGDGVPDGYVISLDADCDDDGESNYVGPIDCDDTNPEIYPGATEIIGDGIDQNCDTTEICYADADDDGARHTSTLFPSLDADCVDPFEGLWSDPEDCDDTNADISPFAIEIPGDGIDQDCDGFDEQLIPVPTLPVSGLAALFVMLLSIGAWRLRRRVN